MRQSRDKAYPHVYMTLNMYKYRACKWKYESNKTLLFWTDWTCLSSSMLCWLVWDSILPKSHSWISLHGVEMLYSSTSLYHVPSLWQYRKPVGFRVSKLKTSAWNQMNGINFVLLFGQSRYSGQGDLTVDSAFPCGQQMKLSNSPGQYTSKNYMTEMYHIEV